MKAKFTKKLVQDLNTPAKEYELHDESQPGLFIRVKPSGNHVYYCQRRRGIKAKIDRTDRITLDEARREAQLVLAGEKDPVAERRLSKALAEAQAKAHTLESYIMDEYMPWAEIHHKHPKKTLNLLKTFFDEFGSTKLADLDGWKLKKWQSARVKAGRKATGINRMLATLRAVLNRATDEGLISENPLKVAKAKQLNTDKLTRVRYLSADEENRLRLAADAREAKAKAERDSANVWRLQRGYRTFPDYTGDHVKPMIILSLNTGIRRGELFNLTWADVDLSQSTLTVRGEGAKSGQTRHIPLNDEALATLKAWKQGEGQGLVFPNKDGLPFDNVNSAFRRLLLNAGIASFRWHDLRHTFASNLVMAGVDLNTVRELLGHADIQMTLRYAHLAPHVKAAAVRTLTAGKHARLSVANKTH